MFILSTRQLRRLLVICAIGAGMTATADEAQQRPPNIIFILADDLGYGELGCYGQQLIQTPNLDRMAAEGMRFTQFYAGSTVCAPSRCVLMTGKHLGHATVRGNASARDPFDPAKMRAQTLRPEDYTVAELLKGSGYATALIGKWGLGELGSGGEPTAQGFDYFFGYLNQKHAHNYYPGFLTRGETRVPLRNEVPGEDLFGNGVATKKVDYSADLFAEEALQWIEAQKAKPFFLYLALTTPHANNEATRALKNGQEVPDLGPYADKDWSEPNKCQAAMITRMDADIGRLFALIKKLGLDQQTLIFFSSDNGPHKEGGNDPKFFNANGGLRGIKRDLYEGGIRVPFIARWPGKIAAGVTSTYVGYFGDLLATISEVIGAKPPANLDSVSFAPTLFGQSEAQAKHEFLYWEFHEGGTKQAALLEGHWKAVRLQPGAALELYDLTTDPGEMRNVAADRTEIGDVMDAYLRKAHVDSPDWPIREPTAKSAAQD
jgi:arylsulfatase A-like enzyme